MPCQLFYESLLFILISKLRTQKTNHGGNKIKLNLTKRLPLGLSFR